MGQGQWYHRFSLVRWQLFSWKFPGPPLIYPALWHGSGGKGHLHISVSLCHKDSNDYSASWACAIWRRDIEIQNNDMQMKGMHVSNVSMCVFEYDSWKNAGRNEISVSSRLCVFCLCAHLHEFWMRQKKKKVWLTCGILLAWARVQTPNYRLLPELCLATKAFVIAAPTNRAWTCGRNGLQWYALLSW